MISFLSDWTCQAWMAAQRGLVALLVFLLVGGVAVGSVYAFQDDDDDDDRRRNWDPTEMLQRMDRDGNKILDTNELGGRGGEFIQRMGFDPSSPIPVDNILRKIQKDREEEERVNRRREIDGSRQVPKFGEPVELPEVPGFGLVPGSPLAVAQEGAVEYSEEVLESVTRILERFDEDGDGFLAGEETRRIGRFLEGEAETDADKDGRLSQGELAAAYQKMVQQREERGENWRGRGRGGDDDDDDDDNGGGGREFRRRGQDEDEGDDDSRRGRGRRGEGEFRMEGGEGRGEGRRGEPGRENGENNPPSREERSSRPQAAPSMESRVTSYVEGLYSKYDTNTDGQLSADERANLKVPFNDTDGDGSISRAEATAYVSGAQRGGGSVSPAAQAGTDGGRRGSRMRDREGSREDGDSSDDASGDVRRDVVWSSRTPVPVPQRGGDDGEGDGRFQGKDKNGDGQLQFAEFVDEEELTDEIYQDFRDADRNGDGVLSPEEYEGDQP
jgi:hypothetical protein